MQPLKSLNPIPTIPSLMAELMKGLQHEDDERLCAFIEVVKIPENIHEARIGSKPQDGWEDLGSVVEVRPTRSLMSRGYAMAENQSTKLRDHLSFRFEDV